MMMKCNNNLPISSSVEFCATAQKRIIYLSFTDAGTICNFPDPLIILNNFSFILSEPTNRKQTKPS